MSLSTLAKFPTSLNVAQDSVIAELTKRLVKNTQINTNFQCIKDRKLSSLTPCTPGRIWLKKETSEPSNPLKQRHATFRGGQIKTPVPSFTNKFLISPKAKRQFCSTGRTTETSHPRNGDSNMQSSNEALPTKPSFSISSYKPLQLAYISYEKKSQAKDIDTGVKEKSPLIIQHGLFGTKENWKTVSKEINFITKRTVYSVDGRNHGESPHSPDMTFALMARDIQNFHKQLNYEKISFMGQHGLGGRIGMMVAMLYPEILDKLIVVDSTPLMNEKSQQRYAQIREAAITLKNMEPELRDCHGYKRSLAAEQAIQHIVSDKRDIALMLSNLINESSPQTSLKKGKEENISMTPEDSSVSTKDLKPNRLWKCNLDAFLNPGITDFPMFDESKAFHGKTLFVQPMKSNYLSEKDEQQIKRLFPNAEFEWIKCQKGSNWFHIEKHTEFMQAIVGFLEGSKTRKDNNDTEIITKTHVVQTEN